MMSILITVKFYFAKPWQEILFETKFPQPVPKVLPKRYDKHHLVGFYSLLHHLRKRLNIG
jgi:hypothetical protein